MNAKTLAIFPIRKTRYTFSRSVSNSVIPLFPQTAYQFREEKLLSGSSGHRDCYHRNGLDLPGTSYTLRTALQRQGCESVAFRAGDSIA
jgi:hypothetical protein